MGRKPILPSQRAQPISFSLKPHLIEKIDDYAADLRFSRSKFLQQAVTEYMTRHIVNPNDMDLSPNVNDMSIDRRVAVGLAAIQEANRDGIQLHKGIMDALRRELSMPSTPSEDEVEEMSDSDALGEITIARIDAKVNGKSVYEISQVDLRLDDPYDNVIAHIVRRTEPNAWRVEYHEHDKSFPPFRTLQQAKNAVQSGLLRAIEPVDGEM